VAAHDKIWCGRGRKEEEKDVPLIITFFFTYI